jgi:hypothetical protein
VRALDNSLNSAQQADRNFFTGTHPSDGVNAPGVNLVLGQSAFTCVPPGSGTRVAFNQ